MVTRTNIIYDCVKNRYANIDKSEDIQTEEFIDARIIWTEDPANATAMTKDVVVTWAKILTAKNGPALDGSIEIKDQIAEVKRREKGRYKDGDDYENGDDTDTA